MGLLAGRTDSDLLLLFLLETEVDGSSMESREDFFLLLFLVRDRVSALSSEEEEDEKSLDLRFDFLLEDFFLRDFLLARLDLLLLTR